MAKKEIHPITIDRPMVLIPVDEYEELLKEADISPTPRLSREIRQARARFKKGQHLSWSAVKHALK